MDDVRRGDVWTFKIPRADSGYHITEGDLWVEVPGPIMVSGYGVPDGYSRVIHLNNLVRLVRRDVPERVMRRMTPRHGVTAEQYRHMLNMQRWGGGPK